MTFSLKRIMSKRSLFWTLPLLAGLLLLIHGSLLGLTDDEAYYWVLSKRPALGYAFHPPLVAWLIAIFSPHTSGWVRLPGILCFVATLMVSMSWLRQAKGDSLRPVPAFALLLSFTGYCAFSWMMVPDAPLFLGWTLLFFGTWKACFDKGRPYIWIAMGAGVVLLSKYSGLLAVLSSAVCLWMWAPKSRRFRAIMSLCAGSLLALLPILVWNSRHEWASILWQIQGRHGAVEISIRRYALFWMSQILLAGPIAVLMAFRVLSKGRDEKVFAFLSLWILPALLVFCVQPLFFDFKPHWALIAWWPAVLAAAYWEPTSGRRSDFQFQRVYGLVIAGLLLLSCHYPWIGKLNQKVLGHYDPRWDVTNDLVGWDQLGAFLKSSLPAEEQGLPLVGSRYQTASQAAFALPRRAVTLIPRDLKSLDEWPELGITDGPGPEWPRLLAPVLFVADNRYSAGPMFRGARCALLGELNAVRSGLLAKKIFVWKCVPDGSRP